MSTGSTAAVPAFGARKLGLILIVALVIAGLAALDWTLARTERAEMQGSAARNYRRGVQLLKDGKTAQAVDSLRTAHSLELQNEQYSLGLIEALIAAGKISEAEPLINEVLQDDPNDGRANLIAARLMRRKGKPREAEAYYHRAIYGDWPADAAEHRIAVRLELIDHLREDGNPQDLLAELLPLEQEADGNQKLEQQLAHLFLTAGSPARAADVYRRLIQHDPNDSTFYAGLAEADLQQGDYRAAHANFLQASHLDPQDPRFHSRLQLASTLVALDPTPRELPSLEKYRRSLRILALARADIAQCITQHPSANTAQNTQLLAAADAAIAKEAPAHAVNEIAESVLNLAAEIWQARLKTCRAVSNNEESLELLMQKLAR